MGAIRREKGVLKLVHPGRYIEIHREPITAEEVMRRNPRHCITRPDVFKFPWIVVKPQALLLPGRVFFIVPYHTIYNLIKSRDAPSSQNQQYPYKGHTETSLVLYSADITTKHQSYKHFFKCLQPTKMSPDIRSTVQKQSQDEVWPKMIRHKDNYKKIEQQLQEESTAETSPYDAIEYRDSSNENGTELLSNEQVIMSKSCFRKPDSIRRSLVLKVSFNSPVIIEEKQGKYNEVLEKFPAIVIRDW